MRSTFEYYYWITDSACRKDPALSLSALCLNFTDDCIVLVGVCARETKDFLKQRAKITPHKTLTESPWIIQTKQKSRGEARGTSIVVLINILLKRQFFVKKK